LWLRNFAAEFPGQALCDRAKEHLDLYFSNKKRTDLAPKSRNHIRATLAMFFVGRLFLNDSTGAVISSSTGHLALDFEDFLQLLNLAHLRDDLVV
jgi:hypothetical protein